MAKKRIKVSLIRSVAKLQCTEQEAASFFGISLKGFKSILVKDIRAQSAWQEGLDEGKRGLRRKQFRLAGTNAQMAIFLGKQILDQKDVSRQEVAGVPGKPLEVLDLGKLNAEERKQLRGIVTRATRTAGAA